ncbi:MAG: hypothetical protein Q9212_007086 [Teloschistes hypoglaucus]
MSSSTESASLRERDFRMNKTLLLYTEHFSEQASASRKLDDHSRTHGPAASSSDSAQQDELVYRMVATQALVNTSTQHVIQEATKLWVRSQKHLMQAIAYSNLLGYKCIKHNTEQSRRERHREELFSPSRRSRKEQEDMVCTRLAVGTAVQSGDTGLAAGAFVVAFGTLLHVAGILAEAFVNRDEPVPTFSITRTSSPSPDPESKRSKLKESLSQSRLKEKIQDGAASRSETGFSLQDRLLTK